jgi:hypothetical protein
MKQTRARIFPHDTRAEGKIFSLFEPSTEILRKGKAGKPNELNGETAGSRKPNCDRLRSL